MSSSSSGSNSGMFEAMHLGAAAAAMEGSKQHGASSARGKSTSAGWIGWCRVLYCRFSPLMQRPRNR